jgi:hypothetical protein
MEEAREQRNQNDAWSRGTLLPHKRLKIHLECARKPAENGRMRSKQEIRGIVEGYAKEWDDVRWSKW